MTTAQIVKKTNLFKALSDDQLKAVIHLGQKKSFAPGEEIYRHGQQAKTLYVLLNGSVSLRMEGPEELDAMAEKVEEVGSVFGLAGLTKSHVYSVTAKCARQATVLALDSAGLQEIIRREPANGLEVMAELAQLYLHRLNLARMGISSLYRIFKSQIHKAEVFDVYGELDY
jgi:CRP-like cAMP-binding protein